MEAVMKQIIHQTTNALPNGMEITFTVGRIVKK